MKLLLIIYVPVAVNMLFFSIVELTNGLDDDKVMFFSPLYLYRMTEMNIFGCIICSIIIIAVNPIYSILATVIWSVWKLLHIGRKIK